MVIFTIFTPPVDNIVHQQTATTAYVNDRQIGIGTLYITETLLSWCDDVSKVGFSLQYPNISLHAVRREPFSSLYVMLDHQLILPESLALPELEPNIVDPKDSDEEETDAEDPPELTELMFSPAAVDMLPRMFSAMNECQAMHPDPEDEDSDIYEDASAILDDDLYQPLPMEDAEEHMQGLHIGVNNGHSNQQSPNEEGGDMAYDPEQFAD